MENNKKHKIDKKMRLIIFMSFILVIISLAIPVYLYFSALSDDINVNKPADNIDIVDYNYNLKYKNELVVDNDYSDNGILFGKWVSTHTEVYKYGNLSANLINTGKYIVQIYKADTLDACYMLSDGSDMRCMSMVYTFIDNKLGVGFNSTYLNTDSEITINGKKMTIKDTINENMYTLLYLNRED